MIPFALVLLGLMPADRDTDRGADTGPQSGRYVERAVDGRAACDVADANRFTLHLAPGGEPPHPRSANVGRIDLALAGWADGYILTARDDRWHFGGGRPHTVGTMRDGVTSAFLTGRFELVLAAGAAGNEAGSGSGDELGGEFGDLRLIDARFNPVRRGSAASVQPWVIDGAGPDGRPLRPFSRCDG
jgi:hypothetical protein